MGDEFFDVEVVTLFFFGRGVVVEEHIVSYAAAYEGFFYFWEGVDAFVEVEEAGVVSVHVFADVGVDAGGAGAFFAEIDIATAHVVHVGRGAAEVAEVAFEAWQFYYFFYFSHNGLF